MHLLFVCTGNICRSPTAERLAVALAGSTGLADFQASSAGIRALVGQPIHSSAAAVLRSLGGDPSRFVARQLTPNIANTADLLITMTRDQRDHVLERSPRLLNRTFTIAEASSIASDRALLELGELAARRQLLSSGDVIDVHDPIGQPLPVFEEVGAQIASLLAPIVAFCYRSNHGRSPDDGV